VARPPRHHRVHASARRAAGCRVLRREAQLPLHDVARGSCVRDSRRGHQEPAEAGGEVWYGVGPEHSHPQGGADVPGSELPAQAYMPLLYQRESIPGMWERLVIFLFNRA